MRKEKPVFDWVKEYCFDQAVIDTYYSVRIKIY